MMSIEECVPLTTEEAMKDPEISEEEFGRIAELGEKARADGKPRKSNYKNSYRRLAFSDGWLAKDAELKNPDLIQSLVKEEATNEG